MLAPQRLLGETLELEVADEVALVDVAVDVTVLVLEQSP